MDAAPDPVELARPEHTVTLRVPDPLYERVQRAAEALQRPFEDVMLEAVATALPPLSGLPAEVADDLASLTFMNDAAVWSVARSTPPPEQTAEMEALLAKKGQGQLTGTEPQRLEHLVHAHEMLTLRRAQAAVLLQRRGYDVSDPAVFAPSS
jgi:predicted transcriptional regulator